MPETEDLQPVFKALRAILKIFEPEMAVGRDAPDAYVLNMPGGENGESRLFASAEIEPDRVSFRLAGPGMFPDLLDGVSQALRARMLDESRFGLRTSDIGLFREVGWLTKRSFDRFRREGLL